MHISKMSGLGGAPIKKLTVMVALLAAVSGGAWAQNIAWTQAPGYYRLKLGDLPVTVISDGTIPRDLPLLMSKPDLIKKVFGEDHQALPAEISINCFLIDTGDHRILIDTGAGELFGPGKAGELVVNLKKAGYDPENIDTILLTHIHADHSGGLSIGGRRVFPNATVYVDDADPEFWLSKAAEARTPQDKRITFEQSQQTVNPYVAAGRLKTFHAPATLMAGIRAIPERGHTPGLTGYIIESKGQRLLVWGDIIHAADVQFREPSVTIQYDVDPKAAASSRERILAEAATNGELVGGAHIAFPGLGHVARDRIGYSWVPLPWSSKP